MKNILSFEEILRYYKGDLKEVEKKEVEKIIKENWHYQEMLNGLIKLGKEVDEPDSFIDNAKKKFISKLFPLSALFFYGYLLN